MKLSRTLHVSLRVLLTLPFVIQLIITVGIVGYLSYRNGQQAVNQLVINLQPETNTRVVQYLNGYLKTPKGLLVGTSTPNQSFTIDRLLVQVVPYHDNLGLDWLLVTVVPDSI